MASLRRLPNSCYWIACYTDSTGRQRQRSTKIPHGETSYSQALAVATKLEEAYRRRLSVHQFQTLLASACEELHGVREIIPSIQNYVQRWLREATVSRAIGTQRKYSDIAQQILTFFRERLDERISELSLAQMRDLRRHFAERFAPSTATNKLKITRMVFRDAFASRWLPFTVNDAFPPLGGRKEPTRRRKFGEEEIRRLLEIAGPEWRGMIITGLCTGQRLGDVARLTWQQIDEKLGWIDVWAVKTKRFTRIPVAAPLREYLSTRKMESVSEPLFKAAFEQVEEDGGQVRSVSGDFHKLLVQAGLAKPHSHVATGKGRSVRRKTSELGFHSFRRTASSLMIAEGIPREVVMDIVGHDSREMSELYTEIDDMTKLAAIKKWARSASMRRIFNPNGVCNS